MCNVEHRLCRLLDDQITEIAKLVTYRKDDVQLARFVLAERRKTQGLSAITPPATASGTSDSEPAGAAYALTAGGRGRSSSAGPGAATTGSASAVGTSQLVDASVAGIRSTPGEAAHTAFSSTSTGNTGKRLGGKGAVPRAARSGSERALKSLDAGAGGAPGRADRRRGRGLGRTHSESVVGSGAAAFDDDTAIALRADDPHVLTGSLPVPTLGPELYGVTGLPAAVQGDGDNALALYSTKQVATHMDTTWAAAKTGKHAFMSNLDLHQWPLDVETWDGWTPLTRAALIGDPALVRTLLVRGANPNVETRLKHTPLTYDACCILLLLLLSLLVLDAASSFTALEFRVCNGHSESLGVCIAGGRAIATTHRLCWCCWSWVRIRSCQHLVASRR